MTQTLPSRTREYRSYLFNSLNWDLVAPRDGDVVISTSYKSGTTWMQNIVLQMLFRGQRVPAVADVSPWVDKVHANPSVLAKLLEAQTHRRVMKSHLPLDGAPYHAGTRYIVCVRDARDVFMSLWNHLSEMTPAAIEALSELPTRIGPPMPAIEPNIHAFWASWINRGWFPGESEGYPHSANMAHTQSWWNFRHLPNILFVHFADLLADPAAEISRVAAHLGLSLSEDEVRAVVMATSFAALRENAASSGPVPVEGANMIWTEGLKTFFFKGTNGRWRDVLSPVELRMYEKAKRRVLTPDCAAFTELGRQALNLGTDRATAS